MSKINVLWKSKKPFPSSQFWNSKLAVMQISVTHVHKLDDITFVLMIRKQFSNFF